MLCVHRLWHVIYGCVAIQIGKKLLDYFFFLAFFLQRAFKCCPQLLLQLLPLLRYWRTMDWLSRKVRLLPLTRVALFFISCWELKLTTIIFMHHMPEIMTSTIDMREESGGRPVQKAKVSCKYSIYWFTSSFIHHVAHIRLTSMLSETGVLFFCM